MDAAAAPCPACVVGTSASRSCPPCRIGIRDSAPQEVLIYLQAMARDANAELRQFAANIESNIFYDYATLQVFVHLMQHFNPQRHAQSYLRDLVYTVHLLLRALEQYLRERPTAFVRRAVRRRKRPDSTDIARPQPAANAAGEGAALVEPDGPTEKSKTAVGGDEDDANDTDNKDGAAADERTHAELLFDFRRYVLQFARPDIVAAYLQLAESYASNEPFINHCVTRMLHRIGDRALGHGCGPGRAPRCSRRVRARCSRRVRHGAAVVPATCAHLHGQNPQRSGV